MRAAVPKSWITRMLGKEGVRGSLVGGAAGAPLMLCCCCVTPVFTGAYERGAKLGPSLALMLGAPGLNPAALVLTFALLPLRLAIRRVACALLIVFGLSALIGRKFESTAPRRPITTGDSEDAERGFPLTLLRSLGYTTVVTLPLMIVVGVVLSGLVLPYVTEGVGLAVVLVAAAAVAVALPSFLEIPIALILLQLGVPTGVCLALVVAGPIIKLPPLLVVAREAGWRVAVALAAGVWLVASIGGLSLSPWP